MVFIDLFFRSQMIIFNRTTGPNMVTIEGIFFFLSKKVQLFWPSIDVPNLIPGPNGDTLRQPDLPPPPGRKRKSHPLLDNRRSHTGSDVIATKERRVLLQR